MTGVTLDTGALIALEAGHQRMIALIEESNRFGTPLLVPAGVLAQAWRGGQRQFRVAKLLRNPIVQIVPLDRREALEVGRLCAQTGASDVVDVSVVVCAKNREQPVVTSDPGDLRAIDSTIRFLFLC